MTTAVTSPVTSGYKFNAGEQRFIAVQVHFDKAKLEIFKAGIRQIPGGLARIAPPALNKTADEMKTWLYRELATRVNLKRRSLVRDRLTVNPKATSSYWTAGVRISRMRFMVASFKNVRQTKIGVQWSPAQGVIRTIPRAFIQEGFTHYASGEYIELRQVWRRRPLGFSKNETIGLHTTDDLVPRYPIEPLRGLSLASAFSRDKELPARTQIQGEVVLVKKLHSQIDRFIQKAIPA